MQDRIQDTTKETIVNKDDLIIQMLQDIKNAQAAQLAQLNNLYAEHTILKTEIGTMKNGYEPHQVTQMLHWLDKKMKEDEHVHLDIKKSFINWIVPGLLSLLMVGIYVFFNH